MTDEVQIEPGQIWRHKAHGLTVEVLTVGAHGTNGFVEVKGNRRSSMRRATLLDQYRLVSSD